MDTAESGKAKLELGLEPFRREIVARLPEVAQHIEEIVPRQGGLVEETTGQLDRILAHFSGFRCAARDGEG